MTRSYRITTEPHHIDAVDEFEAISSWFQMIQFTGFFIQEYEDANPVGDKGNRRLVIAENKTGGQLIISVKEESKADMIRANQDLRHNLEKELSKLREQPRKMINQTDVELLLSKLLSNTKEANSS